MKKIKCLFVTITLFTAVLCPELFCACNEKEEKIRGENFTLQQAFDNGYLTHEDLENIKVQPIESLGENLKLSIRQTVVDDINNEFGEGTVALENISVSSYYGTFNGGIAVDMLYSSDGDGVAELNHMLYNEVIDGVIFRYSSYAEFFHLERYTFSNMIMLWKPDNWRI